jgi:hypothetical protein
MLFGSYVLPVAGLIFPMRIYEILRLDACILDQARAKVKYPQLLWAKKPELPYAWPEPNDTSCLDTLGESQAAQLRAIILGPKTSF